MTIVRYWAWITVTFVALAVIAYVAVTPLRTSGPVLAASEKVQQ